jgi:AraC-like DNA-binding protein
VADLSLILKFASRGYGERKRRYATPWRALPFLQLEVSDDGEWQIEFENRPSIAIPPGEILIVTPNWYHRLTVPRSAVMHSAWFSFHFEYSSGLPLTWQRDVDPRAGPLRKQLREHLDAMTPWLAERRVGLSQEILIAEHSYSMLNLLAPKYLNTSEASPQSIRLQPVLEFIHANLGRDISRQELARILHLSPTRFHTVFREAMGIAPIDYVTIERIRRARELLVASSLSVREIAEECGFNSPFYFSRMFRSKVGQSPSEYRAASLRTMV